MDEYQYHDGAEDGFYGTGPLRQKKNNGMLIAVLLVIVIFLCGVVSFLGVLNVKLFKKLSRESRQPELPISVASEPFLETEQTQPVATAPVDRVSLDLHSSPASVDTVPEEAGLSLQEIYSRNIPAVVSVTSLSHGNTSSGTGVIISPLGFIVTNNHVIENASQIIVKLTDDRELEASVVGTDDICDLAVLRIEAEDLTPAQFGDSERLRVGDSVVAIGDPLGENFRGTMTNGIVSAINRDVAVNGMKLNLIQTNAALNSGNSGGPLINCYGQVIGINTMKIGAFTDVAGVEGIGFALPSTLVKDVVEQLISNGFVSGRPTLGIAGEQLSPFYQHYFRMPTGLYITWVDPDGPCGQVGLTQGDVLLKLDDAPIRTTTDLSTFLFSHGIGDTVTMEVYREGRIGTAAVTLTEKTN